MTPERPAVTWQTGQDVRAVQRRTPLLLSLAQVARGIGFGAGLSLGVLLATDVTQSEGWAGVARTSTTAVAAAVALPSALLGLIGFGGLSGFRAVLLALALVLALTGPARRVAA